MVILFIILANYIINNLQLKKIRSFALMAKKEDLPLVSVLVPARNEEANIKKCLASLMRQDYPATEVIMLDDNSTDRTYDIASKLSKKYKRMRVIKGKKLKEGWLGKNYACWQLALEAKGSVYLFTDADTVHLKDSVSSALAAMSCTGCGGISLLPHQQMVTFHERMMVPFGNLVILCFFPVSLINKRGYPLFCSAMGLFMMFRKEVYNKIGGHKSVKSEILEDLHIARIVKKQGYKFMLFGGEDKVRCRMYRNLKEVAKGYSRILFPSLGYNVAVFSLAFILVALIFLLPFLFLPISIILNWPLIFISLLLLQVLFILLIRLIHAIRFNNRIIDVILHPVSIFYLLAIGLSSFYVSRFGGGVKWKDRGL